jgi:hypothetical protein
MILYNVTSNIHESIHEQWLTWMQQIHIPSMLRTGKFTSARLVRVLVEEEMGGVTYSTQYATPSKEKLNEYYTEYAPSIRADIYRIYGDKILSFRTELELVGDFFTDGFSQ